MKQTRRPLSSFQLVIVAMCLCVFVFGTHAKLVQYQGLPQTFESVESAKLWIGDYRTDLQPHLTFEIGPAFCFVFFWLAFCLPPIPLRNTLAFEPTPRQSTRLWYLQRFFRPPPAIL